ncbi:MAG: ferrous iron transport protein A [Phycisphaerales bacterium]|nr:ferrous iron transport protein A [Phycisphaerales bacterium]
MTTIAAQSARPERINLPVLQLRRGDRARVHSADLPAEDLELLRAMGLRTGARIRVCRLGKPCILELCDERCGTGCRIGLDAGLAARLMVSLED